MQPKVLAYSTRLELLDPLSFLQPVDPFVKVFPSSLNQTYQTKTKHLINFKFNEKVIRLWKVLMCSFII